MGTEHPFAFNTIYVIESLPAHHLHTGRRLCDDVLSPLARENGIGLEYSSLKASGDLVARLAKIKQDCEERNRGPIIHIEAHGAKDGLELRNGEFVAWDELRRQFTEINVACRVNLLVVMAMCEGGYLASLLGPKHVTPVWGLLGPNCPIGDRTLLRGTTALYSALFAGQMINDAVARMNNEVGDRVYEFVSAELLFWQSFRGYMSTLATPEQVEARASSLVERLVRERRADVLETGIRRTEYRELLANHRFWYDKYKREFLMIDQFPENLPRFPLSFDHFRRAEPDS